MEFSLEEGGSILVEVDERLPAAVTKMRSATPGELAERAKFTFEAALEKIRPVADVIISKLRALGDSPNEVAVNFGIKLTAEAGAIIASDGAEANYNVTLTWKKEPAVTKS